MKERFDLFYGGQGGIKNEDQVFFDGNKMRNWMELNLLVVSKKNGQVTSIKIPFKNCNIKHYAFLGATEQKKFASRLCPDEELFMKFARVKGAYANVADRVNLLFELRLCNKEENPNCKPIEEVDYILENTFWTLYSV